MNQQPPPNYPPPSGPYGYAGPPLPPPPRKSRTPLIIGAAVVGVLIVLCLAFAIASPDKPTAPAGTSTTQDDTNKRAATATSPAAPSSPAATSPAAAAPATPTKTTPAPVRVGEGTYTVGEDIPPGRYKAVERADADCYWEVNAGSEIVANNVGGGFPTFTVKKGQQVQTARCPEFVLQTK